MRRGARRTRRSRSSCGMRRSGRSSSICARVPMFETLLVFAHHDDLDYGYKLEGSLSLGPVLTEATHFR